MKQYTITENNDWEGEIFGYIIDLTEEEYQFVYEHLKYDDSFTIEQSNYSENIVKTVNEHSENTYQDRLNFYKFKKPLFEMYDDFCKAIDENPDYNDCEKKEEKEMIVTSEILYKGKGLQKIKSK